MDYKERLISSLWGFVLGDVWGVPYEFQSKGYCSSNFKPFNGNMGIWNQPKGTWSDDTSMLLSMLESFDCTNKTFDLEKHKYNLKRLGNGEYSINGNLFDIGQATKEGIYQDFKVLTDKQMGNGGLTRCFVLSLTNQAPEPFIGLTHSTLSEFVSCFEVYTNIWKSLLSDSKIKEDVVVKVEDFKLRNISGTVQQAVDICLKHIISLEPLDNIIRLGGDTDSNGALYGVLYYSQKMFPDKWKKKIRDWEKLERIFNQFVDSWVE